MLFFNSNNKSGRMKKINHNSKEVRHMKKLLFIMAVIAVFGFAFGSLAAEQKTTPAKTTPSGETWLAATGVLQKIDAATKTFDFKKIVKPKGGKATETMMAFVTDGKTKIFKLGAKKQEVKLSFSDLKVGQTLWITYMVEGGKNIAKTIEIRP
jgi:hypothetical protein